ncbi:hypothetical protein ACFXKR_37065 [Streptomyces violascens]|uniref:hypothetical protein n=1 Tax=Streptomyces violascens TaxID=67381 RepID=UPI00368EB77E
MWDTADAALAENLAAARAYFAEGDTLAAPRHATALDKPVRQWLTNVRRSGGLGKDPARAAQRAAQLAAVDPDGNPAALGWTVDWQRHHVGLKALLSDGALLTDNVPGVTWQGDDIGRWLTRQQRDFGRLNPEQQKQLARSVYGRSYRPARRRCPAPRRLGRCGVRGASPGGWRSLRSTSSAQPDRRPEAAHRTDHPRQPRT